MSPRTRLVVEAVAPFVAAGLVFGLLYNTLFYPRRLVEYVEAGSIGVLLGLAAGLAEQNRPLERWLQGRSLTEVILLRTAAYSLAVATTLSLVLSIEPATLGECPFFGCVSQYVRSRLFARDLVFSTGFVFAATLAAEIVLLIGRRNLTRLITGRFRKPRERRAEFMFVDIRGSTALAERLGHERYSALLRDYFADLSAAIVETGGEIYQYVGDEVVVVWPGEHRSGRWLDCFQLMRAAIAAAGVRYHQLYAALPEFKAGVHAGPVVVTEVGTLQRAHVYHGDVLNTAARIQEKCNELGYDLLASRDALSSLDSARHAGFASLGELSLRGRSGTVAVFGWTEAVHAVRS